MSDKIVLTRNQLAKFLPTPEAVKAFENLFLQATQLTPSDVNTINENVQVATISADTALGIANYGLSVLQNLSSIIESLEIQPPEVPTIIEDEICITQNININDCDCLEIIKEPDWNFIKNHPTTISGYGITDAYSAVVADAPLTGSGTSGNHLSIPAASAIQNGYLSSTDWGTFNGKQASYTNLTSIGGLANGTGWLYNNGSGTFSYSTPGGVVTSVTGTSPINSSGGTTPAISIDQSDSTHNGYLSSTDWSTFNNKQSALTIGNLTETTSSVLTITGGTGAIIGSGLTVQVKQASHTLSGYLSSTDWDTFNGKQAAYTNLTTIGGLANSTGWLYNNGSGTFSYSTPSKSDVGLSNVTNDVQVKAISSTDNAIVRFNSTSGQVQDSSVLIDDSGRVGIGTTSPNTKLDVGDTNANVSAYMASIASISSKNDSGVAVPLSIWNSSDVTDTSNSVALSFLAKSSTTAVRQVAQIQAIKEGNYSTGANRDGSLAFLTAVDGVNTEKMRITSAGNVGIGTSSPSYQLHLSSDSAAKPSTNTWTISSDERLKENIELANLDRCYEIVKTIPLKRYTWKDSVYTEEQVSDRSKLGWIANDVQTVFPKAVNTHTQQLATYTIETKEVEEQKLVNEAIEATYDNEGNEITPLIEAVYETVMVEKEEKVYDVLKDCLDLNSDQIYAVMYGAIQKLQLKIEELEAKIDKTI